MPFDTLGENANMTLRGLDQRRESPIPLSLPKLHAV